MRYRFAREGIDTIIGNHLKPYSMLWEQAELPINYNANWTVEALIGVASDIRREDDGQLTAEVKWNDHGLMLIEAMHQDVNAKDGTLWLTIVANMILEKGEAGVGTQRVVHQATIRELFVTMHLQDPWAEGPFDPNPWKPKKEPE